jgi:hypothetical protein
MTHAIATKLKSGQVSINKPLEIPIYHQDETIGYVTQKRI